MSSEIYELMKRSDEGHVVEKAHRRPRFVEDCVREMVAGVIDQFPTLDDDAFVLARQVNLETIHQHNVVAERTGTMREIREELRTGETAPDPHQPPGLAGRRALGAGRAGSTSMQAIVLERPGERLRPRRCRTPPPAPGSSCSRSPPAPSAAPICTCATARSRPPSSPSCSAIRSSGRAEDGRRYGVPWLGYTDGTCRYCQQRPREPLRQRPLHRPRHRRRLRRAHRRRRALLPAAARRVSPTSSSPRCCAAG